MKCRTSLNMHSCSHGRQKTSCCFETRLNYLTDYCRKLETFPNKTLHASAAGRNIAFNLQPLYLIGSYQTLSTCSQSKSWPGSDGNILVLCCVICSASSILRKHNSVLKSKSWRASALN